MRTRTTRTRRRTATRIATVVVLAAAGVIGAASPSWAAADALTLSASKGPSAGGNTIVATAASPTAANAFIAGSTYVEFQAGDFSSTLPCTASYGTPAAVSSATAGIIAVPAGNVRIVSPSKLAITVPAGVVVFGTTPVEYNVCVYSATTGNNLIAGTAGASSTDHYIVAVVSTITGVVPAAGSSQGGSTITVTGTNFPATIAPGTATVAGAALTGINRLSATVFTATIPPHTAGGPFNVSLDTPSGTVTKNGAFTYSNGITLAPNTAPNNKLVGTDIDIQGVGFSSLDLSTTTGATPDDTKSHIYLAKGTYDPKAATSTFKTNMQIGECLNALVVSDTELICTIYLAGNGPNAQGNLRNCATCSMTSGSTTLTSTANSFSPADIGMTVSGSTGIPFGATIVGITDAKNAVLSKAATAAVSATTVATQLTIAPVRTVTDAATTNNSTTLTSPALGLFTAADKGRTITGPGIQDGTTITAVTAAVSPATSSSVTLSQAATAGGSALTITVGGVAVPVGTYTMTVVTSGSIDAQNVAGFSKSVISSGSTFTVADY